MNKNFLHTTVLLKEAVSALVWRPDGLYVDGTFGRGGHARAILTELNEQGRLLVFDKDPEAIEVAMQIQSQDARVMVHKGSFAELATVVEARGWMGRVDGILLDLGVSSPQLDDARRGFSFQADGPLDMRMDVHGGVSAAQWLASVPEEELARVFYEYGEERYSRRIARALVQARAQSPISTTRQLAELIATAHPAWERHKHPATRCFQAIRIAINHELDDLQQILTDSPKVLGPGGRLAVISFHSLEDRLVKNFMRDQVRGVRDNLPRDLPIRGSTSAPTMRYIEKMYKPSSEEVQGNPRARSARLRITEKLS